MDFWLSALPSEIPKLTVNVRLDRSVGLLGYPSAKQRVSEGVQPPPQDGGPVRCAVIGPNAM